MVVKQNPEIIRRNYINREKVSESNDNLSHLSHQMSKLLGLLQRTHSISDLGFWRFVELCSKAYDISHRTTDD